MRKLVYSYVRFSSAEQAKGHSMDRQLDYARRYAEDNNMILDESLTMMDEGLSAYHQAHIKRGAFGVFLSAVESGKISKGSVLIVEGLDRISRAEPIEAQSILSQIIMAGITVVTASDGKIYERNLIRKNPMELVVSLLIFVRANEESENKSRRIKDAIVGQINQWIEHGHGKIIRNGRDPYWCKPNNDKTGFELIPERVEVIKDIIDLYSKGWGARRLVKHLNDNYKPFNGKQWSMQYISSFMKKRSMIGERSFKVRSKNYVIKDYYPPIMTPEEFSDLQYLMKSRATTKSQSGFCNILTGMKITYCGYCSDIIGAQNYSNRSVNGRLADCYRRIYCHSWKKGHDCVSNKTISIAPVEKGILEYCLNHSDMKLILSCDDKTTKFKSELSKARMKLDKVSLSMQKAEDSIMELLSNGETVSPVVNTIAEKLRSEKVSLVKQILDIEEKISYICRNQSDNLISEWDEVKDKAYSLDAETRLLIRQLIKRTFKRIDIFMHGMGLSEKRSIKLLKSSLGTKHNTIDLILTFKNDKTRILSIDRKTGSWVKGGDIEFNSESSLSSLAESQTADA